MQEIVNLDLFQQAEDESRLSIKARPKLQAAETPGRLPSLEGATVEVKVLTD